MANPDHIALLKKGVVAWNKWRDEKPDIIPQLRGASLGGGNLNGADLSRVDLTGADLNAANLRKARLTRANLSGANLSGANLSGADLCEANLTEASLTEANLRGAVLSGADLSGADLSKARPHRGEPQRGAPQQGEPHRGEPQQGQPQRGEPQRGGPQRATSRANLTGANLSGANLNGADLEAATLVDTDLTGADLTGCRIYGVSAWGLKLERTKQQNLVITPRDEPEITVDNIEVAQFIYLLLHNEKIRDVIDTIGKKGVLLLGRFTEGRIEILERLREKLRSLGFVPMVFNFDKPETKDFTETVRLLANLSRFVIVDITNPRSTPLELQATVPDYMVPFVPILEEGEDPFAMFVDLQNKYDWVLEPVIGYSSVDRLIEVMEDKIVRPAEAKFNQLLARRTKQLRVENV